MSRYRIKLDLADQGKVIASVLGFDDARAVAAARLGADKAAVQLCVREGDDLWELDPSAFNDVVKDNGVIVAQAKGTPSHAKVTPQRSTATAGSAQKQTATPSRTGSAQKQNSSGAGTAQTSTTATPSRAGTAQKRKYVTPSSVTSGPNATSPKKIKVSLSDAESISSDDSSSSLSDQDDELFTSDDDDNDSVLDVTASSATVRTLVGPNGTPISSKERWTAKEHSLMFEKLKDICQAETIFYTRRYVEERQRVFQILVEQYGDNGTKGNFLRGRTVTALMARVGNTLRDARSRGDKVKDPFSFLFPDRSDNPSKNDTAALQASARNTPTTRSATSAVVAIPAANSPRGSGPGKKQNVSSPSTSSPRMPPQIRRRVANADAKAPAEPTPSRVYSKEKAAALKQIASAAADRRAAASAAKPAATQKSNESASSHSTPKSTTTASSRSTVPSEVTPARSAPDTPARTEERSFYSSASKDQQAPAPVTKPRTDNMFIPRKPLTSLPARPADDTAHPADARQAVDSPARPADIRHAANVPARPADIRQAANTPARPADIRQSANTPARPADIRQEANDPARPPDIRLTADRYRPSASSNADRRPPSPDRRPPSPEEPKLSKNQRKKRNARARSEAASLNGHGERLSPESPQQQQKAFQQPYKPAAKGPEPSKTRRGKDPVVIPTTRDQGWATRGRRDDGPNDRSNDRMDRSSDRVDRSNDRVDRSSDRVDRSNDRVDRSNDRADRSNDRVDRSNDRADRSTDRVDHSHDRTDRYKDRTDRYNDRNDRSNDRIDRSTEHVDQSHEQIDHGWDSPPQPRVADRGERRREDPLSSRIADRSDTRREDPLRSRISDRSPTRRDEQRLSDRLDRGWDERSTSRLSDRIDSRRDERPSYTSDRSSSYSYAARDDRRADRSDSRRDAYATGRDERASDRSVDRYEPRRTSQTESTARDSRDQRSTREANPRPSNTEVVPQSFTDFLSAADRPAFAAALFGSAQDSSTPASQRPPVPQRVPLFRSETPLLSANDPAPVPKSEKSTAVPAPTSTAGTAAAASPQTPNTVASRTTTNAVSASPRTTSSGVSASPRTPSAAAAAPTRTTITGVSVSAPAFDLTSSGFQKPLPAAASPNSSLSSDKAKSSPSMRPAPKAASAEHTPLLAKQAAQPASDLELGEIEELTAVKVQSSPIRLA